MRVITGTARGKRLKTPQGMQTRPTAERVKEAVFSAIQFELQNAVFLDLFAGSGQMGIEALSRGAKRAVFVDGRREACNLVKENLKLTALEANACVVQSDYLAYLNKCRETFDIVYLDPPFAEVFLENALKRITEIDILSDCGIILCERPSNKALDLEFPGLSHVKDYQYGTIKVSIFRKKHAAD